MILMIPEQEKAICFFLYEGYEPIISKGSQDGQSPNGLYTRWGNGICLHMVKRRSQ